MPPDVPDDLRFELATVAGDRLIELVDVWASQFEPADVRAVLENPYCDEGIVRKLHAVPRLLALYEVRALLVRQRALPLAWAVQLVPGLYWRDLSALASETRVRPQIRRAAELRLAERLPALAVGERVNLARRASPRLIQLLGQDRNPRVCRALLENPRLTEGQVLPWVSSDSVSPAVLRVVARDRRWGSRYPIRVALCRNPRSPTEVVLPVLPLLKKPDLRAVASDRRIAAAVRRRAELLAG